MGRWALFCLRGEGGTHRTGMGWLPLSVSVLILLSVSVLIPPGEGLGAARSQRRAERKSTPPTLLLPSLLHVQGLASRSRPLTSSRSIAVHPDAFTYIEGIRALKQQNKRNTEHVNPAARRRNSGSPELPLLEHPN